MGNDLAKIRKEKNRVFSVQKGKGWLLCCFLQPFFGVFFYWKNQLSAGGLGPFLKFSSQFRPGFGLRATFGSFAVCLHSKNSVQNGGSKACHKFVNWQVCGYK